MAMVGKYLWNVMRLYLGYAMKKSDWSSEHNSTFFKTCSGGIDCASLSIDCKG